MSDGVIRLGRLHGRTIELHEPINDLEGDVEVTVRPARRPTVQDVFEFLRSLPPGTRTKEDIDAQIAEEREGWNHDGR